MLTVEALVCAANKAKSLADEIDLIEGVNAHDPSLYVALRRSITENDLMSRDLLREVLEKGLTAVRNARADELQVLLSSLTGQSLSFETPELV